MLKSSRYRILTDTVTIRGKSYPVTGDWTVTNVWFQAGEVVMVDINNKDIPVPIEDFEKIEKELLK